MRSSAKLSEFGRRVRVVEADPLDSATVVGLLRNQDRVVFALGLDTPGPTPLFSDTSRILIAAMQQRGVRRLVASTGAGAGQTLGHRGWWYDWIVYPLFTRRRYADKNVGAFVTPIRTSFRPSIMVRSVRSGEARVSLAWSVHVSEECALAHDVAHGWSERR
jgi:hypothetical protein